MFKTISKVKMPETLRGARISFIDKNEICYSDDMAYFRINIDRSVHEAQFTGRFTFDGRHEGFSSKYYVPPFVYNEHLFIGTNSKNSQGKSCGIVIKLTRDDRILVQKELDGYIEGIILHPKGRLFCIVQHNIDASHNQKTLHCLSEDLDVLWSVDLGTYNWNNAYMTNLNSEAVLVNIENGYTTASKKVFKVSFDGSIKVIQENFKQLFNESNWGFHEQFFNYSDGSILRLNYYANRVEEKGDTYFKNHRIKIIIYDIHGEIAFCNEYPDISSHSQYSIYKDFTKILFFNFVNNHVTSPTESLERMDIVTGKRHVIFTKICGPAFWGDRTMLYSPNHLAPIILDVDKILSVWNKGDENKTLLCLSNENELLNEFEINGTIMDMAYKDDIFCLLIEMNKSLYVNFLNLT